MRYPTSAKLTELTHIGKSNYWYGNRHNYSFEWLGIVFDSGRNEWVDANTKTSLTYTNFKPGIKRLDNQTCAVINKV